MKINDIHRAGSVNPYRKTAGASATGNVNKSKTKDEVQISSEAKELLEAQQTNAASDELRAERIQALKQAVASGSYHVDAGKIAEKLLPYFK